MAQCDFCDSQEPKWEYPCKTFTDPTGIGVSVENWAACEGCHKLIQFGLYDILARRSVRTHWMVKSGEVKGQKVMDYVRPLHRLFRLNRTGEPFPIVETV